MAVLLPAFLLGALLTGVSRVEEQPIAEHLLVEASCTACHASNAARLAPRRGPDLGALGARYEPAALRRFLAKPHAVKPGTAMPDVLAGLAEDERARAANELTHLLVSLGGPLDATPVHVTADTFERGRWLYHSVGCVACHAPQESAHALRRYAWEPAVEAPTLFEEREASPSPPGNVPLGNLAARTTVPALAAFLADPLATRPDGRMPSLGLTGDEAHAIAAYLLRDQARSGVDFTRRTPGLVYEYFEAPMRTEAPSFGQLEPVRRGVATHLDELPEHRADHFGFRFGGFVDVPARGAWRFATTSDDGSRLWIDGELVVTNDGFHPMTRAAGELFLDAGLHTITVEYFEQEGGEGLVVEWEGPGVEARTITAEHLSHASIELAPRIRPFEPNAELIQAGAARFRASGCGACHTVGERTDLAPEHVARELAALSKHGGCLSDTPLAGIPHFDFDADERAALARALSDLAAFEAPSSASETVTRTLKRFQCLHCHERDDVGGVHPERRDYFLALDEAHDMGDQARYPPPLDHVGRKLRAARLREILEHGTGVRPYIAARMPRFGAANVGHLVDAFADADLRADDDLEPPIDAERIAHGRKLVGTAGLGCIQCHAFAGFEGLGTPAVDLADTFEHTRARWFAELLRKPAALGLDSRMPDFWIGDVSPVRDLYDGDPDRQIEAIRAYLSLGRAAPLPEGLVVPIGAYEVIVGDEPRLVGVFMEGVSPRTIVVGTPEGLHYAYDVQHARLAKVWRGRFFDAYGTWHARAGVLERPPVDDVFDLPAGMELARLEAPDAPWPVAIGADAGFRRVGHGFDDERYPVWRSVFGELVIEERLRPRLVNGAWALMRQFRVECGADAPPDDLYLRTRNGRERVVFTKESRWVALLETEVAW